MKQDKVTDGDLEQPLTSQGSNLCSLVDSKLKKAFTPFKKAKAKGVMNGVPLTQEGVCQVLDQYNGTENSRYRNIWYRDQYVQRTVDTKSNRYRRQSLRRTVGIENRSNRQQKYRQQ